MGRDGEGKSLEKLERCGSMGVCGEDCTERNKFCMMSDKAVRLYVVEILETGLRRLVCILWVSL